MTQTTIATYVVGSAAAELDGWTPADLAEALAAPLAALGVEVECSPNSTGVNEGLHVYDLTVDADALDLDVRTLVERVIESD